MPSPSRPNVERLYSDALRIELARVDDQCSGGDVIDVAMEWYDALLTENDRLQAVHVDLNLRVVALEAALRKYGHHLNSKREHICHVWSLAERSCTCGLDAALTPGAGGV